MSFLTYLALGVAALALLPVLAHLLRRGREREVLFPAAFLLEQVESQQRQRTHLSDRALLGVRVAVVCLLALLGASPLVQCSKLSVARPEGGAIALALVLDNSHSMRARTSSGQTRFERAREGARELLDSLQGGDSVTLIAAERPPRLLFGPSSDLNGAREVLEHLTVTDRRGDTPSAAALARAALVDRREPERRVVLLGDLADWNGPLEGAEAPLAALAEPVDDCGLVSGSLEAGEVTLQMACAPQAQTPRRLIWEPSDALATAPSAGSEQGILDGHKQLRTLRYSLRPQIAAVRVRLLPEDANPTNDTLDLAVGQQAQAIAVVADAGRAGTITGGGTVLEQALAALAPNRPLKPLTLLPDAAELATLGAVVVDDPPGLSPEARAQLQAWVEAGGTALGFLGPGSSEIALSASLEPFALRGATWQKAVVPLEVDLTSLGWLGPAATSLSHLGSSGRAALEGNLLPDTTVRGRWSDGPAFLTRRTLGDGQIWTVGLPVHVAQSDLALRVGFLGLLQHVLSEADTNHGPLTSDAGTPWLFTRDSTVQVEGPEGALKSQPGGCSAGSGVDCAGARQVFVPEKAGRYAVTVSGRSQQRQVWIPASEITELGGPAVEAVSAERSSARQTVSAAPHFALALLSLFGAEALWRLVGLARRGRRSQG